MALWWALWQCLLWHCIYSYFSDDGACKARGPLHVGHRRFLHYCRWPRKFQNNLECSRVHNCIGRFLSNLEGTQLFWYSLHELVSTQYHEEVSHTHTQKVTDDIRGYLRFI
uniref:Putative secreted protein n=1 Tax=Rhipicephalus microplus TaxID=6941 RepID=A0A6G5A449_RHIMP